jgi:hypothetical protein
MQIGIPNGLPLHVLSNPADYAEIAAMLFHCLKHIVNGFAEKEKGISQFDSLVSQYPYQ